MASQVEFHYCLPTKSWRAVAGVVISLALLCAAVYAISHNPDEFGVRCFLVLTICFFVLFTSSAIVGFIHPSATEMRVDDRVVFWRMPWPIQRECTIDLASIVRITAWTGGEVDRLAFRLSDGTVRKAPLGCFGCDAEPVLRALRIVAPQLEIHRRKDSFLDWRAPA